MAISINSFIIPLIICFGLLFAVFGGAITSMGDSYDISGYDEDELASYNHLDSLESRIKSQAPEVEGVNVDSSVFDWFAGLWSKLKSPFVFVAQSYRTLITVTDQATDKLQLMPAFKQAIGTIIILLVVFGLLAARYFLGRR